MYETRDRVDTSQLGYLAANGQLYQATDSVTASGGFDIVFQLFNPGTKGTPIRLISARFNNQPGSAFKFATISVRANGNLVNKPVNLGVGGPAAQAQNTGAEIPALTGTGILSAFTLPPVGVMELVAPAVIVLPPHTGVIVDITPGAFSFDITWLWAELPSQVD